MSQEESTQDTAAQNNNLCCVTYLWEWVSFTLICSAGVDGQMIACFPQRSQRKGTSFLISPDLNGAMFDTLKPGACGDTEREARRTALKSGTQRRAIGGPWVMVL